MEQLNTELTCQSCGIFFDDEYPGTNVDGSPSNLYCGYCFQGGQFVDNVTLTELAVAASESYKELGMTREEAYKEAYLMFKKLKRWEDS